MSKRNTKIFIFERNVGFRTRLFNVCRGLGRTWAASNQEEALKLLNRHSFDLLLLEWAPLRSDAAAFWAAVENFQPRSRRIALFPSAQLKDVIEAMRSGMNDVHWDHPDPAVLKGKVVDLLIGERGQTASHSYVTQLAESLADRAMTEKMSLFKARREFAKIFLGQLLQNHKMKRLQLAKLMNITPRTLQRHLFD
jgi:DNA-binding NtrC family response regulator